jgi:hypothetical protein
MVKCRRITLVVYQFNTVSKDIFVCNNVIERTTQNGVAAIEVEVEQTFVIKEGAKVHEYKRFQFSDCNVDNDCNVDDDLNIDDDCKIQHTDQQPQKAIGLLESDIHEEHDFTKRKRGRPAIEKKRKGVRGPSAYNLYVRSVMDQVKRDYPTKTTRECMTICAGLWRAAKSAV